MIVADQKPFAEIKSFLENHERIIVAGCGTCVTICHAGGQKEAGMLATGLGIAFDRDGKRKHIIDMTVQRQCDEEFCRPIIETAREEKVDAVVTMACGAGLNFLAGRIGGKVHMYPGVNTRFYGAAVEHGVWQGLCAGCGDCTAHLTGGICPTARCAKSLVNGPCGGMKDGKCEISQEADCGWNVIVSRMKDLGTYQSLRQIRPPRDWTNFGTSGMGMLTKRDIRIPDGD